MAQPKVTLEPGSAEPGIGVVIWGIVVTVGDTVRVTGIDNGEFSAPGAIMLIVVRWEPTGKPNEFAVTVTFDGVVPPIGESESHAALVVAFQDTPPLESVTVSVVGDGFGAPIVAEKLSPFGLTAIVGLGALHDGSDTADRFC